MVQICPECGYENDDDAFWCEKCNAILFEKKVQRINEEEEYTYDLPYADKLQKKDVYFPLIKIPIILIIVGALIFSGWYFVGNIGETNFDWERYGGCPWDQDNLPWSNSDFPWMEALTFDDLFSMDMGSQSFSNVGEINQDYWFEGDSIKTSDGWTFTIDYVQSFSYQAKVLGYQTYNKDGPMYKPSETFSQVDIFLGFDDIVSNPQSYPYSVVSYAYRGVWVDSSSAYFMTHITNTHIIPHSATVLNNLKNIKIKDVVTMSGYYVNVYGTHSSSPTRYSWTTDTTIGNSHCEVILLDSFQIVSSFY